MSLQRGLLSFEKSIIGALSHESLFHKDAASIPFALLFVIPAYRIIHDKLTKKHTIKEGLAALGDSIGTMSRWLTPLLLFLILFTLGANRISPYDIRNITHDINSMKYDISSIESDVDSIRSDVIDIKYK